MTFLLFALAALLVMLASVAFSTALVTLFVTWIYQHQGRSKRSLLLLAYSLGATILAAIMVAIAVAQAENDSGYQGYDEDLYGMSVLLPL